MQKRVLSLLVDNTAGVTTRVSGLFSRRGYNIDSITGGVTADERFSRITVRETVLVKVAAAPEQRQGIISIADVFHAKVADVSKGSLILEMTGNHNKLEAFIDLMGDYEILELARAGVMGLERGSHGVKFL